MTDLTARERGTAAILEFAFVRVSDDPKLVELFEELNARYFDATLPLVHVCRGIPDDTGEREDPDGLMRLTVFRRPGEPDRAVAKIHLAHELFEAPWGSEEDRWEKVADILLHEMVHLAVQVDAFGGAHPHEEHHGEYFAEECNRIGEREGWAPVLASAQDVLPNEDAAAWPDNAIERGLAHP